MCACALTRTSRPPSRVKRAMSTESLGAAADPEKMRWSWLVMCLGLLIGSFVWFVCSLFKPSEPEILVLYCRLPGCRKMRRKREGRSTDFCSSDHAALFGSLYCLYPECTERANDNHFCSKIHLQKARSEGVCGLAKLDSNSSQFKELKYKFSKSWCSKKGRLPKILSILEIVNPKIQERLEKFVADLKRYKTVEQYYHGTQIQCEMLEYYEPCSHPLCGVCGISKKGFDPELIQKNRWHRFGNGFYFAPNSSKSYDYPRATHSHNSTKYRCMLICDIAPGRKYNMYRNDNSIEAPPSGYHSVYGNARWLWFWKSPDLNYDELVVFDTRAIWPHYILFLEDTSS